LFAFITISPFFTQAFIAGDHFSTFQIITHQSTFSTTAQIHSKSQDSVSLNDLVSSFVIYSLCLSHIEFTIHFIAHETISSFFKEDSS
jgi:hypothetical protein